MENKKRLVLQISREENQVYKEGMASNFKISKRSSNTKTEQHPLHPGIWRHYGPMVTVREWQKQV